MEFLTRSQREQRRRIRQAVRSTGKWLCHICGKVLNYDTATIDHVNPLSQGGRVGKGNTRLACATCNSMRGVEPVDFYKMRTLLVKRFPCIMSCVREGLRSQIKIEKRRKQK